MVSVDVGIVVVIVVGWLDFVRAKVVHEFSDLTSKSPWAARSESSGVPYCEAN